MHRILIGSVILLIIFTSCSRVGLLSEKYPEEFYKVPKLLPDTKLDQNYAFIIYSDNQSGWRIRDVFWKKSNWINWKILIFPFYEIYLAGNGIIGSINRLRNVPDYGEKERLLVRDAIYATAKNSEAKFILNVGDIAAHDGRRPDHWATFLRENKHDHPLLDEIPYLTVIGNHEYGNDPQFGFPNYQAIFDYPRFYVIEFPDAAIYVVDSNFILDQNQFIDDSLQNRLFEEWFVSGDGSAWLEKQLMIFNKPFKIVAMHHPPINYGKHHQDWLREKFGENLLEKRRKLLKLFEKHQVQVVFSGHEHVYQHNILEHDSGIATHFLVGGGGGTPLRELPGKKAQRKMQRHFEEQGFHVAPIRQEKLYHFYQIAVANNELSIKVQEVTGKKGTPIRLVEYIRIKNE
jgi:hypothetical protein